MAFVVKNISKSYGEKLVIDNVSFSLDKPGVLGLIGTNGAGKTTTIRIILNILSKDSGEVLWDGIKVNGRTKNFGYLPEERGLYPKMNIYKQLLYFASLKNLDLNKTKEEIDYWMEKLNILEYKNKMPNQLSKGNSQKVQLVIALLGDPKLLILDEPFSGLDPVNSELLKDIINELVKRGKYIIFCSHQMQMVEQFCENIVIINNGKIVKSGNLKEIKESYPENKILLETKSDVTELLKIYKYEKNNNEYIIQIDNDKNELLEKLLKSKIGIEKFMLIRPSLQEIFIESVKDNEKYN